jgi:hypothetical protein
MALKPSDKGSPVITVLIIFALNAISMVLCEISGETAQLWAPGVIFLLPFTPYPQTLFARLGVLLSLLSIFAFAGHGNRRSRLFLDSPLRVGIEGVKVGVLSGLLVGALAFALNCLMILQVAKGPLVNGGLLIPMSLFAMFFSGLWLAYFMFFGLIFTLIGGIFTQHTKQTCIVKLTVNEDGEAKRNEKTKSFLITILWSLSFGFIGLILSLWWAASYIYEKAEDIHFITDRFWDVTREYLGVVFSMISIVLINARINSDDLIYMTSLVVFTVSAFTCLGFVMIRLLQKLARRSKIKT